MSVLTIRPAQPLDAGRTGEILGDAMREHDWMPVLHSRAEDIDHMGRMIDLGWVTVADDGRVRGFMAREDDFIHALYVARGMRGYGIGRRLIETAQADCRRLELWTFVANTRARRFYEHLGFVETERTDGTRNEENLPDMRYVWSAEAAG